MHTPVSRALGIVLMVISVSAAAPTTPVTANALDSQSIQLFQQFGPVLQSPRCMNCHTNTGFPRQGDDRHPHKFNVMRGPASHGAPGFACSACHTDHNQAASGVPGAPNWGLAPPTMFWETLSLPEICGRIRNPANNGNRNLEALVEHLTTDPLVQWAWMPGSDSVGRPRNPPPVGQEEFHELVRKWAATGGICPP